MTHPNKAANVVQADHHQRIIMSFQLKDRTSQKLMTAHQSFIRLKHVKTSQEIIFIAEPDSAKNYKFDLDIRSAAKDFAFVSGKYNMDVIIGDAIIKNPFVWAVVSLVVLFL